MKAFWGKKKKVKFPLLQKGQAAQGCSLEVLSGADSCIQAWGSRAAPEPPPATNCKEVMGDPNRALRAPEPGQGASKVE